MRIYKVTDLNEKEEIYKFRYYIYAEIMKKNYKYYDHERKQIYENLDLTGRNYVMRDTKDNIIATVRLNYTTDNDLSDELARLKLQESEINALHPICLVSKLILHKQYWNSHQSLILMKHVFSEALKDRMKTSIIYCFDTTLPFFERMGFVKKHQIDHEYYKKLNVLVLDLTNKKYLETIRSPFAKLYNT